MPSPPGVRTMRSSTSSNGTSIGACGLCTVTFDPLDAGEGEAGAGDALGERLDEIDRLARR